MTPQEDKDIIPEEFQEWVSKWLFKHVATFTTLPRYSNTVCGCGSGGENGGSPDSLAARMSQFTFGTDTIRDKKGRITAIIHDN